MVRLKCPSCGHVWDYKGKRKYYTNCPNCHRNVNIAKYKVGEVSEDEKL
jgi:predicted  nucleic acid-binding Zn-ribbon protein